MRNNHHGIFYLSFILLHAHMWAKKKKLNQQTRSCNFLFLFSQFNSHQHRISLPQELLSNLISNTPHPGCEKLIRHKLTSLFIFVRVCVQHLCVACGQNQQAGNPRQRFTHPVTRGESVLCLFVRCSDDNLFVLSDLEKILLVNSPQIGTLHNFAVNKCLEMTQFYLFFLSQYPYMSFFHLGDWCVRW